MFKPGLVGDGTTPVPLKKVSWECIGNAYQTNGEWFSTDTQYPTNQTGVDTYDYPQWSLNISSAINGPWSINSNTCQCA